jgi:hypothetical protein
MSMPFMTLARTMGMGGCLGLLVVAQGAAEDLKIAEFDYLRVQASIGAVEAPEVEEDTRDSGGTSTTYDWNGGRESGYQAALTALWGRGKLGGGGWQFGGELVFGFYDITPKDFTVNGGIFGNGSSAELDHRTIGVNLVGGYQWGIADLDEFTGFVEILPYIGGGFASAESEVHDNNGNYATASGDGAYFEAGLRLGAYITEKRYIYGVNVSYAYSYSEVDIDFAGGFTSEVELIRRGFGIAAVAGYRF